MSPTDRNGRSPAVMISLDGDLLELLGTFPELEIIGFLDANPTANDPHFANLGSDQDWPALKSRHPELKAVLAIDPPPLRARLAEYYGEDALVTVVAGDARVSANSEIGRGSVIQRNVLISRNVRLGRACKIHYGAMLHHDVSVGEYSTVAPGAMLLGNVTLGSGCYIGAGAIILPRHKLGDGAIVGAGAVVVNDVASKTTVLGIPARRAI